MKCPSCSDGVLSPTALEPGLPALSCGRCGGVLLSMLSYRMWLEQRGKDAGSGAKAQPEEVSDTTRAISCPKCHKLMSKFRIDADNANRLDSCGYCGELWVDGGEWELLGSLDLTHNISSILSQPWQRQVARQEAEGAYEERLRVRLGEADYTRASEFRDWLRGHEEREAIMLYLARSEGS